MNTVRTAYGDFPGIVRKAWYTGRQVGTTFLRIDQLRTVSDTRSVVNYDISVGDILQVDPYSPAGFLQQSSAANATTQAGLNAAKGFGFAVGAPNIGTAYRGASAAGEVTAFTDGTLVPTPTDSTQGLVMQPRLVVVTHIHPDVNRKSDPNNSNSSLAQQRDGGWIDVCSIGYPKALFYKNTDILVPAGTPLALWQPVTSAAVASISLYGDSSNDGRPALTNLLAADMASDPTAVADADIGDIIDQLSRIHARLLESDATVANGGTTQSTHTDSVTGSSALRRVALGGFQFGI
jgi:hypothetical protein